MSDGGVAGLTLVLPVQYVWWSTVQVSILIPQVVAVLTAVFVGISSFALAFRYMYVALQLVFAVRRGGLFGPLHAARSGALSDWLSFTACCGLVTPSPDALLSLAATTRISSAAAGAKAHRRSSCPRDWSAWWCSVCGGRRF